ncbi:MAG TPA: helix-turn-helix transcriptional regulator [Mycobacterium sp.]|nr:helix-turn-helix transcriptional regulator [Mycobacterium sp.]
MSRETAGATIRALREARDWSLADFAAATGVSIMGLSFLERGARKPHKGTVQKIENGLGLPPGTYARLVLSGDPPADLAELLPDVPQPPPPSSPVPVVIEPPDATVLEEMAEAQIEALKSVIGRLPAPSSNEYETYIHSVLAQCVKFEALAANSWRVAINGGADPGGPLLRHVQELEALRLQLLALLPGSLSSRFDAACSRSSLPETVIAALLGISVEQSWQIRNQGAIPPAAVARVQAFVDGVATRPDAIT